jgi:hypothetical protein
LSQERNKTYFLVSRSLISCNNDSVFVGGGGGAAADGGGGRFSWLMPLTTTKMQNAMMMNSKMVCRNAPY